MLQFWPVRSTSAAVVGSALVCTVQRLATVVLVLAVACEPLPWPGRGSEPKTVSTSPRIAVPAYFYSPLPAYQQLAQNTPVVGLVVANVVNGPGGAASPEWAAAIGAAHRAGAVVLGYVDTGYIGTTGHATRPTTSSTPSTSLAAWRDQVRGDVNTWYRFYGAALDGVFFDQTPNLCGPSSGDQSWVDFYFDAAAYVKDRHPRARVVSNPGQVPDRCYAGAADTIVTFEGPYATYVEQTRDDRTPGWARKARPDRIWHLVYEVSPADLVDVIARAGAANAGYVYATNLTLPNPWAALPPDEYWNQELARVGGAADRTPPTVPRRLRTREVSSDRVTLAWESSRDDVAVTAYDVYQGGALVTSVHGPQATVTGLAPATRYRFTVRARDPAGNVSPRSAALEIITLAVSQT